VQTKTKFWVGRMASMILYNYTKVELKRNHNHPTFEYPKNSKNMRAIKLRIIRFLNKILEHYTVNET
jgi:hypothetical protein